MENKAATARMQLIPPMSAKYGFCFTLNNYTPANVARLSDAIGRCGIRYMVFGKEVGASGTPHLQGYLQTNQKNKSRIYDMFNIHVKPQERTATQAADYCKKDGDVSEFGVFDPSIKGTKEKSQGSRSDIDGIMTDIDAGMSYAEVTRKHAKTACRIGQFIREQIQFRDSGAAIAASRARMQSLRLYPWQQELLTTVEQPAEERAIHWIWCSEGRSGKSTFATYLLTVKDACVLTGGKSQDLAFIFAQAPKKIVVFDLSRTAAPAEEGEKSKLDHLYSLAETLKNGRLTSTKYHSTTVAFEIPHVIFFANFECDYTKWTADRYNVRKLTLADCV